ncbi:phage portal protein [Nguyenibacter vanlangensis]|nr:DUF1073 domain-containing protein [Nguyenibacter vanlangensis]
MDSMSAPGLGGWIEDNYGVLSNFLADGLGFMGYPQLAEMMQRAEFRKPVEVIAKESTREWIKFTSTRSGDDMVQDERAAKRMKALEAEFRRLRVRDVVRRQIWHGLAYGLGHVWIGIKGAALNSAGQDVPLVIGSKGLAKGSVERLVNIDPIWTNPNTYNADNPLKPDYYRPQNWWVQGTLVDQSRILTMVPFEVSDILKPAFNFGGLSLTQQLRAYVHNFLRTRQSVSDMVSNYSFIGIATNMEATMQNPFPGSDTPAGEDGIIGRAQALTRIKTNNGAWVYDKESEDIKVLTANLSGLNELQAQSQEFMASIPGIPLVKLFGIQPTGLNASSDGEIRVFYDEIAAFQEANVGPILRKIFHLSQLNLWGEIDPDLDFEFVHLWQMDEKQLAEIQKIKADTDAVLVEAGIIAAEEGRERQATDEQSNYRDVDLTGPPPEPPDPEQDGAGLEGILKRGEEEE